MMQAATRATVRTIESSPLLGCRIRRHAREHPERPALVFLEDGERLGQRMTYGELDLQARHLAGRLESMRLVGERVLLTYPPGLDFVIAFVACLYAGVVAVPAYPPRGHRNTVRVRGILENAGVRAVLTTAEIADPETRGFEVGAQDLAWLATERLAGEVFAVWSGDHPTGDDLAFLQYTSGATGSPKGVMVSHRNLAHNEAVMSEAFGLTERSRVLGWLPLFHDMGLIGNVLQPLYLGATGWLMAPLSFVRRPLRWLRAISQHRITTSGGPNFAYDLCVRELERRREDLGDLDLSCWRVAFNGAEPIRASTLSAFADAFAPWGFRAEAFAPCYGLAEATLLVSVATTGEAARTLLADGAALERNQVAPPRGTATDRSVVGCGPLVRDLRALVVSPETGLRCGADEVGEIWLAGGSVAQGYWGRDAATEETFRAHLAGTGEGPFLRTGDLGFLREEVLWITGRLKELIILRGRNHYPQDLEATAQSSSPALRRGGGAAFGVPGEAGERLVLVQEVGTVALRQVIRDRVYRDELMAEIRAAVVAEHDLQIDDLVLIRSGHLPKTSSGKVRRAACRERYLRDALKVVARQARADALTQPPEGMRRSTHSQLDLEELLALSSSGRRRWLAAYLVDVVAELSGITAVDSSQPLARAGLDSLQAVRFVARVEEDLQLDVALETLVSATPTSLAELLSFRLNEGSAPASKNPVVRPEPEKAHDPFPLTDLQQAYWVGRRGGFELASPGCHTVLELETERLDPRRVAACWERLVARHPMLRVVVGEDGTQRILPRVDAVIVSVLDLTAAPATARRAAVAALRDSLVGSSYDCALWPLFELRVTHLSAARSRLHVKIDLMVADGSSLRILLREWFHLYRGLGALAPAPSLTFRDYVLGLRGLSGNARHARAVAYWQDRLATLPPAPELPTAGRPEQLAKPRIISFQGLADGPRVATLEQRAKEHGTTLSVVFLAVFSEILAAWSRTPRFTLNITLFNRLPLHPEVEAVVGDFTTSLPLAVDLERREPFEARSRAIQQQLWRDLEHRTLSGVALQRQMARQQEGSLQAVLPVVFTSTLGLEQTGDLPARLIQIANPTPQVWLNCQVVETGEGVLVSWDVIEGLFPQGLAEAMFGAFEQRLQDLAEGQAAWKATCVAGLLPVAQAAVRAQVNDTAAAVSGEMLHTLVHRQAVAQPLALALVTPSWRCTYGQLWQRAERLAADLVSRGACPNRLVAVVLTKGWQQAVAVLAVSIAGGAYIPIDPGLPARRRAELIARAETALAVTNEALDRELAWPGGILRCLVDGPHPVPPSAPFPAAPPPGACPRRQRCTDLAYVLFTSGSTGQPKGVMIDHRGAVNTVLDVNRRYEVSSADRVLALSALGFDLSVYDLFGVLAAGGTVVLPADDRQRDPEHWAQLMRDHRVTLWNTVPALLQMLVEFLAGRSVERPPDLRLIMLSGDWIPLDLPPRITRLWPGAEVHSLGGATEASIWSIAHPIVEVDPGWASVPYGRPMVNQVFHVFDQRLEPCPDWVAGDLYIGGIGLARGYWRDAKKTASAFVAHPQTGERLYRTGDRGRYLPSGDIEFLGRSDRQVKLDGYRIELGEIEAVAGSHGSVQQCIASIWTGDDGRRRLIAHAVAEPTAALDADMLRAFLAERLPGYMVPFSCQVLAALPLTSNGKIDRKRLPAPGARPSPRQDRHDAQAPRTPLQGQVTAVVCEVLGLARAGRHQNFFDLGASSVQLIRVHRQLERSLRREIPVVALFRYPTIAALTDVLEAASAPVTEVRSPARAELRDAARFAHLRTQQQKRKQALQQFRQRRRSRPGVRSDEEAVS